MGAPLPEPQTEPEEVRRLADEILSRSEFHEDPPGLLERIYQTIGDAVADLFGALLGGGGNAVLAWLILAFAVGIVAFLLFRLGRTVQHDPVQSIRMSDEHRRPSVEWIREAEELEARGEWREALRCRYRALVNDLVVRRVVPDVPGRTAGEYRREVADASPAVASDFAGATELFELAWYGHRATGPEESQHFRQLAQWVREGAA